MKMKGVLTGIFLVVFCWSASAQSRTVTGQVTSSDGSGPLPGVTILVKGTTTGTTTDFDGNYTLQVSDANATLVFSFIGYITKEIVVGNQSTLNVAMEVDIAQLEEVVVIGYGTTTEKELTGAVSVVKSEAIEALNPTRVEQALQGQTPGVQISSQSGSPGGGFNVRIRGISTNGNNNPLILVDGVRYEDLSSLNPNNIESVNILKDASASIYGVQAANGVVLITTKTGRLNTKPVINLDMYYGVQETMRKLPVLNATEYGAIVNEAYANGGSTPPFPNLGSLGEGTDWQEEVFSTAPIQNYNFNAKGGGEKSTYSFGLGYFNQEGIVGKDKSSFDRLAVNINTNTEIFKNLNFETVINYTNSHRKTLLENVLGSVLFNALNMAPNYTPRQPDGSFTLADGLGSEVINPLAQIENTHNDTWVNRVNGKFGLRYEIIEGLTAETNLGYNFSHVRNRFFSPEAYYGAGKVFNNVESAVGESQTIFFNLAWDSFLRYEFDLNDDHQFKVTLGSSIFKDRGENLSGFGYGIPNNNVEFADLSQANEIRDGGAGSYQYDFRLLSYFGRVEYNYQNKYLFSVIVRRDGTSRFGPGNKFGYFPAVSAGWVLSEESFFPSSSIVDFAKLRASYGITGNDQIGDFRFLSTLTGEAEYVFDGNTLTRGLALGALANPEIQWEQNKQFNMGLDLELLGGRFSVTADYFIKTSEDLLLAVPASGLTGVAAPGSGAPIANAGSIRNSGFEFMVNYNQTVSEDFDFSIGYNFTSITNETIELNDGVAFIQGGFFGIGQLPPTRWEVGQPIGYFYGLQTDGIFQTVAEVEQSAQAGNAQPGDLRYRDLDGNGVIDVNDRTRIGNPIPDMIMGISLNARYKSFDFSMFTDAQLGHDIIRNYERNLPLTNRNGYYLNRWYGEGTSNDFPRVSIGANDNDLFSDFWVEDGSYARIKNVQVGYTLPESAASKLRLSRFRVYASINNLYTFTQYRGYDPNISSGDPLGAGIDIGYYPQPRTYLLGLNASF